MADLEYQCDTCHWMFSTTTELVKHQLELGHGGHEEKQTIPIEEQAKKITEQLEVTLGSLALARKALNDYSWAKENREGEIGTVYDAISYMLKNADSLLEASKKHFYESTYRHLKQLHKEESK